MSKTPEYANVPANSGDPQDHQPDTVATPEGDNEYAPGQPLQPTPEGLETPPGFNQSDATQQYKQDKPVEDTEAPEHHKPEGVEKVIDEFARGTFM